MTTEIKMRKFPSIEQFRNVVKHVQMSTRFVGIDDTTGKAIYDPFKTLPILDFVGTVKVHGCVSEDTLITLADGSQEKIKDIIPNTSILSYNEKTKEIEFDVVKNVILQKLDKPWVELKFDNGIVLKCTEDHPILTKSGWIKAGDLTENDEIITNFD